MTINQFSTGKDVTLTLTTSYGTLTIPGLLEFTADPEVTKLKSKGIDGNSRHGVIPDGWKGSFKLDRLNYAVDNLWAQFEADYYAGKSQTTGTILEIIQESDGTITQWQYDGVVITLEKAGDYKGDTKVEQTITFEAAHKTKLA
jgi:hypothetical protein